MYARASGQMRAAVSAATAEITPSMTTGTRCSMLPRNAPAMPAISKPPTFASTSTGSSGSGRFTASARAIASRLRARPASDSPAPCPAASCGASLSSAQAIAAQAVVLPMPISPVAINRYPFAFISPTSARPEKSACSACARVIAGPRAMFAVPRATLQSSTPGTSSSMPISTASTSVPDAAAIRLTFDVPSAMARATSAVTPLPLWETPSATTP